MFVVLEPSGFISVVSVNGSLVFPAASLYTSFQGLFGVVMVQLLPRMCDRLHL